MTGMYSGQPATSCRNSHFWNELKPPVSLYTFKKLSERTHAYWHVLVFPQQFASKQSRPSSCHPPHSVFMKHPTHPSAGSKCHSRDVGGRKFRLARLSGRFCWAATTFLGSINCLLPLRKTGLRQLSLRLRKLKLLEPSQLPDSPD